MMHNLFKKYEANIMELGHDIPAAGHQYLSAEPKSFLQNLNRQINWFGSCCVFLCLLYSVLWTAFCCFSFFELMGFFFTIPLLCIFLWNKGSESSIIQPVQFDLIFIVIAIRKNEVGCDLYFFFMIYTSLFELLLEIFKHPKSV